jgi:hypothetical protein
MKREQIIKAIIDSLGLLEDTKGHGYKLYIYKGEWWISHNVVGSGEPVRQWLDREIEKLYQDEELVEIIEEEKCSRCKDISDELINWIKCVRE